jgi:hypothetical protein
MKYEAKIEFISLGEKLLEQHELLRQLFIVDGDSKSLKALESLDNDIDAIRGILEKHKQAEH